MKRRLGCLVIVLAMSLGIHAAAGAAGYSAEGSAGAVAPLHVTYYYLPG